MDGSRTQRFSHGPIWVLPPSGIGAFHQEPRKICGCAGEVDSSPPDPSPRNSGPIQAHNAPRPHRLLLPTVKLLLRWLASAAVLFALPFVLPGLTVTDVPTALVGAVVLALVNGILGPVLRFFSFPLKVLTLGLFALVVNAVLFGIAAYAVPGFDVDGPVTLFLGALLYGLGSWLVQSVLGARKK